MQPQILLMVVRRYFKKLLFLFCCFFVLSQASATHIIGGEINYRCVSPGIYEVTLVVYTECGSQAVLESYYPINYYASDLSILPENPLSFNVNKVSTTEIELFCDAVTTDCSGGSLRGVERVIYKGTVNLKAHGSSDDWRFFWKRAARSEEITTLAVPEAEDFFIEASMNSNLAPCNNSVAFEGSPVATVCINQEQTFNNVAADPDGDELRYSLAVPQSNYDTEVEYADGYDGTNFMTFVNASSLDEGSGDFIFNPALLEVAIADFKVEEYRNGQLIGWVKRGIQFTSIDCSNTLPVLSDFEVINTDEISICAGESVNLKFTASDADSDMLTLKLLEGPSGVFIASNNNSTAPQGKLLWNTSATDAGIHQFIVQVSDNVCPQPGLATKTYTIEIRSTPQFTLGDDMKLSCDETIVLEPEVSGGDGNYSYMWSDGSTGTSLEVGTGIHSLTVTDGTGCSWSDEITIQGEITAQFSAFPLCVGVPVQFTDISFHASNDKEIVGWLWDFGDGSTSSEQNPKHQYAAAGEYLVRLTVYDNGDPVCESYVEMLITICEAPVFDFDISGHCSDHFVDVEVNLPDMDPCNQLTFISYDFGDGSILECFPSKDPGCYKVSHIYDDAGNYDITVNVISFNGCTSSAVKSVEIFPSPEVNIIQDNFFLVCSNPDSLLETEITGGGTGAITYQWNSGATTEDIMINQASSYSVTVTDDKQCSGYDGVTVSYPLSVGFQYDPYCNTGDVVKFHNTSVSQINTITSYSWDFGDPTSGASNSSSLRDPEHIFSNEGDYHVSLDVQDSDGCERSSSWVIYNTSIDHFFEVLPADGEICFGSGITGTGPSGAHIDKYQWSFGDGTQATGNKVSYNYATPGSYKIDLQVTYNQNFLATSSCIDDFTANMTVHPRPAVSIISSHDRFCKDQKTTFSFDSDLEIAEAEWKITNKSTGSSDTYSEFDIDHTFTERGDYEVRLMVRDKNGCFGFDKIEKFADRVVRPDFKFEKVCAKEYLTFTEAFYDTLENITDYHWDFGDGTIEEGQVPIPMITHAFEKGGIYPVTLTVINSFSGCTNLITKMVEITAPPQIDFKHDTICAGTTMFLKNLTTAGDGDIESYLWVFPDQSTATSTDASYRFIEGGDFPVSLISTSSLGCRDTLTQTVHIKPAPVAGVELPEFFIEAFIPLQLYDNSKGDITDYFWDFGDNNTSSEKDPIHTYQEIERYILKHAVTNTVGCTDTLEMVIDLNVYLDLPTAFSPNADNNNDELSLIHQGIKTLYQYKLYNRYGQVVFDAKENLGASWDGKFNGQEQPAGVYVAHVKAVGAYGKEFNFKKNVTLLR